MRRLSFFLASVFLASTLLGCPLLKKKKVDEEQVPADAATVSVTDTGAKNESDVLRYANEEPLDEVAVIGKDGAKARNFPGNGPEVATLAKGTVVKKMAKYFATAVLVMFDDPSTNDGSKLMGWVPPTAFDVAAPKPVWTPPKIVDAGKPHVTTDAGHAATTTDAGHDAAAPAPVDAGAAKPDAGGGNPAADAGGGGAGKIPQPGPGTVAVPQTNGKCPDNWAVTPTDNMCRRVCKTDADCTSRVTKCKPVGAAKLCTTGN